MSLEFDNWDNSSASSASPGIGGLGKCVILAAIVIGCALLVTITHRANRGHSVSVKRPIELPKKDREKWEAIKHLAYEGPGSRSRNLQARRKKIWAIAQVAARVYDQRQSKLPDTQSSLNSSGVERVTRFAALTRRLDKSEQRVCLNIELQQQRVIEKVKTSRIAGPPEHNKLKSSWKFPFAIQSLTIAGVQNGVNEDTNVFTYCVDSSGLSWRVRFDIQKGDSRIHDWFLYDWMVSSSDRNAAYWSTQSTGVAYSNWREEIDRVEQVMELGEFSDAQKLLIEAERHEVPEDMQAEFLLRNGHVWERLGLCGKALKRYRAAGKLSVPGADRRRIWFFLSQKARRHCHDAAQNYLSALGGGAWIHKVIADVETDKHGPALDYDPDDFSNLTKFGESVGVAGLDAFIARIQKTTKPSDTLRRLAGYFAVRSDPLALSHLRELLKRYENDDQLRAKPEHLMGLKALVLIADGQRKRALEILGGQKDKGGWSHFVHGLFLRDVWVSHQARQAYEASPDRRETFRDLYTQYQAVAKENLKWKTDIWRKLTKRHQELFEKDAAVGFVKAELLTPRNDIAKRIQLLSESFNLAKGAKDIWLARIRRKLGELLIFQKKVDKAVQLFGAGSIRELAETCVRFRHWQHLKVLLQLGQDKDLSYFRAELAWANNRPKSALEHLRAAKNLHQRDPTRLLAKIHVRRRTVMTAYKESDDKIQMFRALVAELRRTGNDRTLQRLARIHEKQNIRDSEKAWSMLNRIDSRWDSGNFKQLAHDLLNWPPASIAYLSVDQRNRLANRWVRAWIRSSDLRAASRAASRVLNTTGQTFPLILARAAQRNKRDTLRAFKKGWTPRPRTADLLFDPELSKTVGRKNSRFIREEPPVTPKFLNTLSIRLLQKQPSKLDQAKLYRKISKPSNKTRILKPKPRIIRRRKRSAKQSRNLQFLAFRTNLATFTVKSSGKSIPLEQVELSAYGDPRIAKRLREHKAHLTVTLHGYQGREKSGQQVRQLLDVVRSLINVQTTILVVNERAIYVDRQFRRHLRKIKTLAEFDDNGVTLHIASPSFSPIDLNKHRQHQQKLADVLKNPPRQIGLRVAIQLGLRPVSEDVWVTVSQVDRQNGKTVLRGKLASRSIYRPRLRRGTLVSVDPADVTQWRTKK